MASKTVAFSDQFGLPVNLVTHGLVNRKVGNKDKT